MALIGIELVEITGGQRDRLLVLEEGRSPQEALIFGLVHKIADFVLPPGNKIFQI